MCLTVSSQCSAIQDFDVNEHVLYCVEFINSGNPNWSEEIRKKLLNEPNVTVDPSEKSPKLNEACVLVDLSKDTDEKDKDFNFSLKQSKFEAASKTL